MTKISTATEEQWARIDLIRQKWLDNQTRDVPEDEIRDVVCRMWERLESPNPLVLVFDSPMSAAIAALMYTDDRFRDQFAEQSASQLQQTLHSELSSQLCDQLNTEDGDPASEQAIAEACKQQYRMLMDKIGVRLDDCLNTQVSGVGGGELAKDKAYCQGLEEYTRGYNVSAAFYGGVGLQFRSRAVDQFYGQIGQLLADQLTREQKTGGDNTDDQLYVQLAGELEAIFRHSEHAAA